MDFKIVFEYIFKLVIVIIVFVIGYISGWCVTKRKYDKQNSENLQSFKSNKRVSENMKTIEKMSMEESEKKEAVINKEKMEQPSHKTNYEEEPDGDDDQDNQVLNRYISSLGVNENLSNFSIWKDKVEDQGLIYWD